MSEGRDQRSDILPAAIGALALRHVSERDDEFIFQTIKATMAEYVTQTFGSWQDDHQRKIIKENTH